MLYFLRRLRKSLVSSGNRRYFLYATGEVVLVVIGILIALQINNWNEDRINRQFEQRILTEIYVGLKADSARFSQWIAPRLDRMEVGIEDMKKMIYESRPVPDSIFIDALYKVGQRPYMTINYGPYEALKSNGLDQILDDELRSWLVDAFESALPRQILFSQFNKDWLDRVNAQLYEKAIGRTLTKDPSGELNIHLGPISPKLLKDPRLLLTLDYTAQDLDEKRYRLRTAQTIISNTLSKIESYLGDDLDTESTRVGEVGVRGVAEF